MNLGIVLRLRIVFILITCVIGGAVATGLWQFNTLGKAQRELIETSFPVLVGTQQTERALKDLFIVLQDIEAVGESRQLSDISSDLQAQTDKVRASIDALKAITVAGAEIEQMDASLNALQNGISKVVAIKEQLFLTQDRLADLMRRLAVTRNDTRDTLEDISADATLSLDAMIKQRAEANLASGRIDEAQLNEQIGRVRALGELSVEIAAIIDLVNQLNVEMSPSQITEATGVLQFRTAGIVQLAARLPPSVDREYLALHIQSLLETTLREGGILAEISTFQSLNADRVNQSKTDLAILQRLSDLTATLVAQAGTSVKNSQYVVSVATHRLLTILTGATLVSITIIVIANFVIVERQINLRVSQLTGSVLSIAEGDTDHLIKVHGNDELGRMAKSLEVFKKNARELQRSNAELEKFAYVAAHDLRSPLRAIQDLTHWTAEDDENILSSDSAFNLDLIKSRAARMSQLLSDLLEYARAGKDGDDLGDVQLDTLVREIAELVDPDTQFDIKYLGDDRPITTYVTPLRHILLNLIGNAIKHHDRAAGQVLVTMCRLDNRVIIRVEDDGPGIPVAYHDKVFGLFQTLRSRDEVEGSGLGLAIIQKLLSHYNGAIEIMSDPELGRGTTFEFDLPDETVSAETLPQAA